MSTRKHDGPHAPRRCRGDEGAALVEFAFIAILLFTLLFGIINFGLILSFDQDVTRAAAEGARGGAVAIPLAAGDTSKASTAAEDATNEAVKEMGGRFKTLGCDTPGMDCTTTIEGCQGPAGQVMCVRVKISYNYDDEPLYGDLPLMSAFLPDKIEASSVARINQ